MGFKTLSPFLQMLIIATISGALILLGLFLGVILGQQLYEVNFLELAEHLQTQKLNHAEIQTLKLVQGIVSILFFIGTPIVAALLYGQTVQDFYHLSPIKPIFILGVGIAIFLLGGPVIESLAELNTAMGISTGNNNNELMAGLLKASTLGGLLTNLLIIAVIPAIGEELLFRGLIQKQLINATNTPWLGIVLAGLIFSFFHMEWDYFIPRWFMGIILGIMFYTSRSLWLSIIAHFINNATATIAYFLYQNKSPLVTENPLDTSLSDTSPLLTLLSYVAVIGLVGVLYRYRLYLQNTWRKLVYPL